MCESRYFRLDYKTQNVPSLQVRAVMEKCNRFYFFWVGFAMQIFRAVHTRTTGSGTRASLGRAEKREHSPSREHRENVSYRLGKWQCDNGLGLEFRFPVSLPHTFYMRNGFVSEISGPQKVIMRNRLDMFSEGRVSQKRSRFACKIYGGSETGNRNSNPNP